MHENYAWEMLPGHLKVCQRILGHLYVLLRSSKILLQQGSHMQLVYTYVKPVLTVEMASQWSTTYVFERNMEETRMYLMQNNELNVGLWTQVL